MSVEDEFLGLLFFSMLPPPPPPPKLPSAAAASMTFGVVAALHMVHLTADDQLSKVQ